MASRPMIITGTGSGICRRTLPVAAARAMAPVASA
jgi:hypothetical protein